MITLKKTMDQINLQCDVIPMGEDLTVLLYGGDLPHIGSTVLSIPRASLTGDGLSATSSVLNCLGHKDDVLARIFAERIAVRSNHTTVCICGIHVDGLSAEGIMQFMRAAFCFLMKFWPLLKMKIFYYIPEMI